ncbi:MAG: hypothetical protein VB144_05945 [Clostridia bacterium]|nr:hypothetical protein [Clostridia bacterium]
MRAVRRAQGAANALLEPAQRASWSGSKYMYVALVSFRNKTAYILDVLGASVFYALILFIFVQLWTVLIGSGKLRVEGFGVREMVWYMVVSEGIMIGRARIESETDEEVKNGSIAYALNKPYHYVWFKFAAYWGETGLKLLLNTAIGSVVALLLVGPVAVQGLNLAGVILLIGLGLVLDFFIKMSICMLAFWVEDTLPFFWIYGKLLFIFGGLFAPIEIYSARLAGIARATPFNHVIYGPARLFIRFEIGLFWRVLAGQAVWIVVAASIAFGLYGLGVKRLNVNGG